MSYIGSSAAPMPVAFAAVQGQSLNGTGAQLAFTLNRTVSSALAIEVLVNNVQQSPYDGSYSVSGSTLTFSEAPSSGTGNIYVIFRDHPLGSLRDEGAVRKSGDTMTGGLTIGGNVLASPNSGGVRTFGVSGGTNTTVVLQAGAASGSGPNIELTADHYTYIDSNQTRFRSTDASTVYLAIDAAGRITKPNQPAFRSKFVSSSQSGSAGFWVFDSVEVNVGGCYNPANGRFTAPIAGRYLIIATAQHYGGVSTGGYVDVYKNGSLIRGMRMEWSNTSSYETRGVSGVFEAAANDYFQVYNGSGTASHLDHCSFSGMLVA